MWIHAKSLPLCCPTLSIVSTFCHLNKTGGVFLACLFCLQQGLLDCSRQTRPPGYGHQRLVLWNCYGGQWADADQCDLANVIPGFCMCPILSMSRVTPTECKLYVCQKFWKFNTFWLSSFATRYCFQTFFVFSVSHKRGMYCLIIVMTLLAAVFPAWEPW